ncbi:MAG TPA: DNA gyrase inhibitor YacG [Oxalicibacterium sp.]|uniref:DNA gyrase inhibitor YacG n=1 Tax=Oxalicibacterium sp. TaxID=2766525 RepID=UPI002C4420E5|nr:DNA gyrase inhibitor YacG [Oxalicibacterium sp.]HWU98917.1 DNA gyrase inhibitor YacG [Oxalicibacterium sp.]
MATIVDCPTCGTKVEWTEANKFRPFCSDRCRQIDLGAWAEEKYVIPVVNPLDDFEDDAPPSPQSKT